jgi:hypothetical protein
MGPIRYRELNSELGPTLTLSALDTGMNYRFANTGLTTMAVPTLAQSNIGTFWTFYNPYTTVFSVAVTGTTDVSSPIVVNPTSTYTLRWSGSNYIGSQTKDLFTASTRIGMMTTLPRLGLQGNTQTAGIGAVDISGQVYGRLPVYVVSTTTLDLSANYTAYANTYVYLTNSGFSNLTLPAVTATSSGGTFFQLKNATSSYLSVTVNATLTLTSPVVIPPSNAVSLVVSPNSANTMLLF